MHREHHNRQRAIAAAADAVALSGLWVALAGLRSLAPVDGFAGALPLQSVDFAWHAPLAALVVPAWLLALAHHQAWVPVPQMHRSKQLLRLTRAAGIATLLVLGALFALHRTDQLSRTLVFGFAVSTIPVLALTRHAQGWLHRRGILRLDPWRILAVGAPAYARPLADALARGDDRGLVLLGVVSAPTAMPVAPDDPPVLGDLNGLSTILADAPIDQVYLTGPDWSVDTLRVVADACEEQGVRLSMDANFLGLATARAHLDDVEGQTILSFSSTPVDSDALLLKRALDVMVSASLLLLLAPLLAALALAVRLSDGGPALFIQTRAGLHGRPFPMLKFRSMVVDAESRHREVAHLNERDGPVFKASRDPRITRLGAVLRRCSLDELPQLWNVLRGQMSLVGPRPPIPAEVQRYERWQLRRLSMKPGITCIWQVTGRGEAVDFDEWMRQDLDYIDNWSLTLDLALLARTVPVVLRGRGSR